MRLEKIKPPHLIIFATQPEFERVDGLQIEDWEVGD